MERGNVDRQRDEANGPACFSTKKTNAFTALQTNNIMTKYKIFIALMCWRLLLPAQTRTLDFYLEQGIKNSPLLKDYQTQMMSNAIDSQKVKATFKPQVDLNGQIYYTPNINGYGYDAVVTNGGNYQAQVGVSQQLIMKKSKKARFESIDIENRYLGNQSEISTLDLKKAITDQYIATYKDYSLLQSVQDVLALLNNEEEALKPLVQKGIYAETDFLNVRMVKETQLLSYRQSKMQYRTDLYTLNILCGLDDTALVELSKPDIPLPAMFDPANSVLLRQYRIDSLKFANRKSLIDLNYQPKLSAFGDAGLWTSNLPTAYKNFVAGIGMNLYDGKQRKMEYQKIALSSQISHNYELFYRRQYQQQVQQLHETLRSTDELITETNKQLELANQLIDAYKAQLDRGLVKITDLVLAINNYINFKSSLTQTTISRLQIINQLNYFK
jgi:outer membrane protein TolC